MAITVKKQDFLDPFVTAFNGMKAQIGAGAFFHLDKGEYAAASASASDLATSITRTRECAALFKTHFADTLAHKVVDPNAGLAALTVPGVYDLPTAIAAANAIKAAYNLHRASTTFHYNADATNATTSADASDQTSLNTLVNELVADFTAHIASGPAAPSIRVQAR
jgi:hypothetical protein